MKKMVTFFVIMLLLLSVFSVNTMAEGKYLTRGEAAEMLISACDDYSNADIGDIIRGYADGEVHGERNVTRAEALVMLSRAFGEFPELKGYYAYLAAPKENYTDIPNWGSDDINSVVSAGIVLGNGSGVLGGDEYITREEMELYIERVYALEGTNLKDNFFTGVNKNTLEGLSIAEGKYSAGAYYDIEEKVEKEIVEIIQNAAKSDAAPDTPEGKVKIFYNNIMDEASQNEKGVGYIEPYLESINGIKSIEDVVDYHIETYKELGFSNLFNFGLGEDVDNSDYYILGYSGVKASLPKEAYTGDAQNIKEAGIKYYRTLFELIGDDEDVAAKNAQSVFDFEAKISEASLNLEDYYDVSKVNNKYTLEQLDDIYKTVDLTKVFNEAGLDNTYNIVVMDVGCLEKNAELFTDDNIDLIKNYLRLSLASRYSECLGEDFEDAYLTYREELYGITGRQTDEIIAANAVSDALSLYIDKMYKDVYYSQETVDNVKEITEEIVEVYKDRIKNLEWMTDSTKEKALLKLDTLVYKIGADDNFKDYMSTAQLKSSEEGGSYFQNITEIDKANNAEMKRLAGTKVDKTEWVTPCYTINAFYNPTSNDITVPFAVLKEPIYSPDYSFEENLAGIGNWIGHEVSHAFDNNGSNYDENGNAVNWWTDEDREVFDKLCNDVVEFYDGREAAPGIAESGKLTLSENIADLGSISCLTEIGSRHEGFDFKKMYEHFAKTEAIVLTRELLKSASISDVHSLLQLRINVVCQSVDKFYETFDIQEGDGMWIAPEDRASIW